ncbi:MAG: 5-(carboxyamino)imidazole ribonucleotide mutase [Desulfurellaceae bacterium]|jgi:5-(carboxyamino)imidazole ribonucleotide mutase|nr:5-(carboxyamino)imidazole ribonucleotide mutase [Desulfurellaceae bacterium]
MKVAIFAGSKNDLPLVEETEKILGDFGVEYTVFISSAHRSPQKTVLLSQNLEKNFSVVIAIAGLSAHLPGIIASYTTLPVIGVPVECGPLQGLDALFSIVQMPSGIPVGTMSIGKSGAKNAALFAIQILAINDKKLREKINDYRDSLKRGYGDSPY